MARFVTGLHYRVVIQRDSRSTLTIKAPITTAADDIYCDIFPIKKGYGSTCKSSVSMCCLLFLKKVKI